MYVQPFSVVASPGKVPSLGIMPKFQLPLRVTRQYIRIATGDMKLPAYRITDTDLLLRGFARTVWQMGGRNTYALYTTC